MYKKFIFVLGIIFYFVTPLYAEIKIFEKEVEEAVSRGQSQEQVESFALQKAKRLAVEEAGTYISSLAIVRDFQLHKDEIIALASGVVEAKLVGIPAVRIENGTVHVRVKARINVDTSILDRQIQEIMKEKGALKELEKERRKNKELEEKLAHLNSSEVKRLEELNSQALALEREREKQRLFRAEQALKAKGELSKAEAERIAKERNMQERIHRLLQEQEIAKREESVALSAEQDRIRRAALENEQRWNEISRKAKLSQESWAAIDDRLSIIQAVNEVNDLKREIKNLIERINYQYGNNVKNLQAAFIQHRALVKPKLPPEPTPKDTFETTVEYKDRIALYKKKKMEVEARNIANLEILRKEEILKLAEAKAAYLGQKLLLLQPFIKRLQTLQDRKFILETTTLKVELGEPDADNNRFPISLNYNGSKWSSWWSYKDRISARDFYKTRLFLKPEGIFQIEGDRDPKPKLTYIRVTHEGTRESKEFKIGAPEILSEIINFAKTKADEKRAQESSKVASLILTSEVIDIDGRFVALNDGTVHDTKTGLSWAAQDNGFFIDHGSAKRYCENYRGGSHSDWRLPTQNELSELYDERQNNRYHITKLIRLTGCCPWAIEKRGSDSATFFFDAGWRGWVHDMTNRGGYRALPVRGGS